MKKLEHEKLLDKRKPNKVKLPDTIESEHEIGSENNSNAYKVNRSTND